MSDARAPQGSVAPLERSAKLRRRVGLGLAAGLAALGAAPAQADDFGFEPPRQVEDSEPEPAEGPEQGPSTPGDEKMDAGGGPDEDGPAEEDESTEEDSPPSAANPVPPAPVAAPPGQSLPGPIPPPQAKGGPVLAPRPAAPPRGVDRPTRSPRRETSSRAKERRPAGARTVRQRVAPHPPAPPPSTNGQRTDPIRSVAGAAERGSATPQNPGTSGAASGRPAESGGLYRVKPGDSLSKIAAELLGSEATPERVAGLVKHLWALNASRIASGSPDLIYAGQSLALPRL